MQRLSAAVAVTAGVLALAACSDATAVRTPSNSVDLAPSLAQGVTPEDASEGHVHFMPLKSQAQEAKSENGNAGKPGGGTGITYHGGPVLQAGTKVVAIYWSGTPIYTGGPNPATT